ncbi:MAG: NTP transferase domain-containing protein [Candidatus Lokiarchaeota archaeon]|jgi:bifunctional UDP-N-acetylglucosamine pyrophosphorylase/glucosamine-1-phosphate N-acetyltransferase|nr:NTP transferase domain-containing protein [Candidatus Lokiarchaeota archaeon]
MKAVIIAAGKGTRLSPITSTTPKPMIPIGGKPLLEHSILSLREVGITEILIIVGYRENIIKDYFGDGLNKFNVKIDYISQIEHLGTAHAVGFAKDFVGEDNFLLMYGDLLTDPKVFEEIIISYKKDQTEGLISLFEVSHPQEYGIISLDSAGYVESITEKPSSDLELGNLANAGIFIFNPLIFKAVEKTEPSVRKELEFTDSMRILINDLNGKIKGYVIKDLFWSDIGLPWHLLDANKFLLNNIKQDIKGKVEENVQIVGDVIIGKNTLVRSGSYIIGPCYIGENSLIGPNAFIRPFTSIGDDCHIGMSEIKNSLIFSNTSIPHFNYIGDSIICENVNLGAGTKISNLRFDNNNIKMKINEKLIDSGRRKLGAIIGPNSQTGINSSVMCGKKIGEGSVIGAHTIVNEDIPANTLYYQDKNGITKKSRSS